MAPKKHPIVKQWVTTGSVAIVASCGCSLPFTRNLAQSLLIGIATLPGVAVSAVVTRARHRHQARGKLRLSELHYQVDLLDERLKVKERERQQVEIRVAQLQDLAVSLTDRIDRDRLQSQQLAQHLDSLNYSEREQQERRLELDRECDCLQLEVSQLRSTKQQIGKDIDSARISLAKIQAEIDCCSLIEQNLATDFQQLQQQKAEEMRRSTAEQNRVIHELDLAIDSRQLTHQNLSLEVDLLTKLASERASELAVVQHQLSELELAAQSQRSKLDELTVALLERNREIESLPAYLDISLQQRELKTAKIELSCRQAELNNLEFKLQTKLQKLEAVELERALQRLEPQPPQIERHVETSVGAWHDKFIDNPHLAVLQHIDKHGTIAEAEASIKLGSARSVRQFANKLEEYAQDLPFSIRVESSPQGNRYLKEIKS